MKLKTISLIGIALATCAIGQTTENYTDATDDLGVGSNPHIDITSVDVTVDAAEENITFTVNLNGDPVATNWGKYLVAIRNGAGGTAAGNGWNRPINFSTGMTHWIGGWADGTAGGLNLFRFVGGSWSEIKASYDAVDPLALPVITTSSYSVTVPVTLLNLVPGQQFTFDVYTSGGGGGDGAVDALSTASTTITGWQDTFTTTSPLTFTMPGTFNGLEPLEDEDGDGYLNGEEQAGNSALGYVSDPLIPNYTNMTVPGSFNGWNATDVAAAMQQGDTSDLAAQYEWTLDYDFQTPAQAIAYKFTTGGSFDINWGQGAVPGAALRNGSDISQFVGPAGIYRIFFDQGLLTHTFQRRSFGSYDEFRAAYGLVGEDLDLDADANPGDGWTDHQNYQAGTHPLVNDTDGDGTIDSEDAQPLVQLREITFSVDMNVQIANGNHTVGDRVELLVFSGPLTSPTPGAGYEMLDPDEDGIYTVTLQNVAGFEGQPFGAYKFFNNSAGAPNSGYEEGFDRNFNLGAPATGQALDTVFFSGIAPSSGYTTWAAANAGGQPANQDFDGDGVDNGVEYFFGETGSSFTPNPAPVNNVVSWPRDPDATGVTYKIWGSDNLASWTDVTAGADTSDPNFVRYTLPNLPSPYFVRLEVTTTE